MPSILKDEITEILGREIAATALWTEGRPFINAISNDDVRVHWLSSEWAEGQRLEQLLIYETILTEAGYTAWIEQQRLERGLRVCESILTEAGYTVVTEVANACDPRLSVTRKYVRSRPKMLPN